MRLTPERKAEILKNIGYASDANASDYGAYICAEDAVILLTEIDALKAENEKLKQVIDGMMDRTAYLILRDEVLPKLENENATLRHEFKMAQASMPEVARLRAQLNQRDLIALGEEEVEE